MALRPTIVHLIGFPSSGKYTIAKALARLAGLDGDQCVVIDNHLTSNVIFAALDVDGVRQIPPAVWDRVREVREVLLRTIEEMSPREWSFVFTNVLIEQEPADAQVVDRIARLARERASFYVPVRITCKIDELVRRVTNHDRLERLKWIDPDGVRAFINSSDLLSLNQFEPLEIDVTTLSPEDTAQQILDHIRSFEQ